MKPLNAVVAVVAGLVVAGCATGGQSASGNQLSQRYALEDGNTLVVDADGRMRMFAPDGDRERDLPRLAIDRWIALVRPLHAMLARWRERAQMAEFAN